MPQQYSTRRSDYPVKGTLEWGDGQAVRIEGICIEFSMNRDMMEVTARGGYREYVPCQEITANLKLYVKQLDRMPDFPMCFKGTVIFSEDNDLTFEGLCTSCNITDSPSGFLVMDIDLLLRGEPKTIIKQVEKSEGVRPLRVLRE